MNNFFYKLIAFVFVVVLLQVVLVYYFLPLSPQIKLLDEYLQKKYQIIYFGDSIIQFSDEKDIDRSSVVDMINKINSQYSIGDVSFPAYDSGVYEAMMDYISRSKNRPQVIIIPIGLRSFSPEWDRRPFYQFEKEKFILSNRIPLAPYFFKFFATLRLVDVNPISQQQFLETPVYYGDDQIGTVSYFENNERFANITKENIRDKYIYSYMAPITINHRKIESLENLLSIANKSGIKVYVYITPLDYKNGKEFVGSDFMNQTKANADFICNVVIKNNVECFNLAFDFDSKYFSHPEYPSEHLNQHGRGLLAEKINKLILNKIDD